MGWGGGARAATAGQVWTGIAVVVVGIVVSVNEFHFTILRSSHFLVHVTGAVLLQEIGVLLHTPRGLNWFLKILFLYITLTPDCGEFDIFRFIDRLLSK